MNINTEAARLREQARRKDGKFGHYQLDSSTVDLDDMDSLAGADESSDADFASLPSRQYSAIDKNQRVAAMQKDLIDSISEIVESGKLGDFLETMSVSRLRGWSFNNRLLAMSQLADVKKGLPEDDPAKYDPPMMMSAAAWKREYGCYPKKGTKAIWILAPSTRTITDKNDNGEKEKKVIITGFRSQAEFDISQVQGDKKPSLEFAHPDVPQGDAPPGAIKGLRERIEKAGYSFTTEEIPGSNPATASGVLGYTSPQTKKVVVDSRCTPAQRVTVMAHELAHIEHGHVDKDEEYATHRGRMESEAEATAYMVSRALGVSHEQSSTFSSTYIANWSKGNMDVVQKSLNASMSVFNRIMDGEWPGEEE